MGKKYVFFFQGPTFRFGQDELDVPDRHLKNLTVQFWPEILYWILSRTVTSHQKVHFWVSWTLLINPSDGPPTQIRPDGQNFCGHMPMSATQCSLTPHCLTLTGHPILSVDFDVQNLTVFWTFGRLFFSWDNSDKCLSSPWYNALRSAMISRGAGQIDSSQVFPLSYSHFKRVVKTKLWVAQVMCAEWGT